MPAIAIGTLSQQTGVKVPTIRYYEGIGLLPLPARTESNRRFYTSEAVRRLKFIRHARELGFEIESIRQLLSMADNPSQPCQGADSIAATHLREIEEKIARLTSLGEEIRRMISGCAHGHIEECRVIKGLADHADCIDQCHLETKYSNTASIKN